MRIKKALQLSDYTEKYYRAKINHDAGIMYSTSAKLQVAKITKDSPTAVITEDKEMVAGGIIINKK